MVLSDIRDIGDKQAEIKPRSKFKILHILKNDCKGVDVNDTGSDTLARQFPTSVKMRGGNSL